MQGEVIPFGKYKGQPVEVLSDGACGAHGPAKRPSHLHSNAKPGEISK
jgi:hypothetical protein